ncbi:MAG: glycosyltransferase [Pirellulales bacterium]|nr:glycosyltransferase [Pirellulales bacterium]
MVSAPETISTLLGRPLRLALCITELEPGGAERSLVELATRLAPEQVRAAVYVLAGRPPPPRDLLVQRLIDCGIEVHFGNARHAGHLVPTLRWLARAWREARPDIVHSFLFHANLSARFAARRAGVPHVVCGIRVAEHGVAWHRWLDRVTQSRVDAFACVSESVAEFSATITGLPAEKLVVIPNGVDVARLAALPARSAEELGLPHGRRFLAFVGRLDYQKGIDWLIHLAPRLLAALPEHDLCVVGDGPLRAWIEAKVQSSSAHERIHLLGWRSNASDYLALSEVLLLPSAWEGLPNVVLEAMALARPVVAHDVEGVRELLRPFEAHQLVPRKDEESFIHAVVALAQDRQLAAQLGAENQRHAREEFSFERIVGEYLNLYFALLAPRHT